MRRLFPLLAVVLFASCTDASPFVPNIETTNFASSLGVNLAASTRTSSGLFYRDILVGPGAEVPATGNTSVTTSYAGYLRSGSMFDSGSFTFTTGTGGSIAGYDEGVRGMKVGGTRQLIIPPALGYGSQGSSSIPPNSILVFTVTLTAIH